ncbi:MAG: hypothetical protein H7328_08485 [Bdellovibrio sp.]|nr:hypothetical protein [Bdellovibrio sp.]
MTPFFIRKGLSKISPFFILALLSVTTFSLSVKAKSANKTQKPVRGLTRSISLKMNMTGDLTEAYQFDGTLGDLLLGAAVSPTPVCENKSTFREVLYNQKKMVEVWMDLSCLVQGQKIQLKPHRFFMELKSDIQTTELSFFSEKIKKLKLEIQDLTIKAPKLK